ncbi:hypothetical protein ASPZODRAFT_87332 [Penicilliopsis zonata CBS 506.65]|uniref:Major facilitator superfamily (MFS) profile domain-containing protein n=1 Tax=Penicilliopsis zonata CBS 506.65 TaxID=1073090 RepID=A0A1L9SVY9_9EURO|nr:hypothetical protein ASPZODRAFT_87332 [Penicilliopsis zonata CBS 506.65]OJJ51223.1 hypothetical protein ASPZODRAFT_87332 [Penicilliopsis zonata CBS 506.65]
MSSWSRFRSSRGFVVSVVAVAVFTDAFIYDMIIPILPITLQTRIHVPEEELQMWMSILLAAFGGALFVGSPIVGYYADKSPSRQSPFLAGLLTLAGSTAVFWFSASLAMLVLARVLQGLSAAVVWTVGMAVVVDTVGQDRVGAAMGIVSTAMTVGTVTGPFLGGIIVTRAGYHAVLLMAIALIVLDIVLRLAMIEPQSAPQRPDDVQGLLDVSDQDGVAGYGSPGASQDLERNDESISQEKHAALPGIVRLMCSSSLLIVLGSATVNACYFTAFDTVLPLYVMKIFGWGPQGIGFCFIPLFAPSFLSPVIGHAVDRVGARTVASVGFLLDFPAFLLLRFIVRDSTTDKIVLYLLLLVAGFASTLQMVALMVEVNRVVEQRQKECPGIFGQKGGTAQGYGLFNVAWSGGQVLGPLLAGVLIDHFGWGTMVCTFGVLSAITAALLAGADGKVIRRLWGGREDDCEDILHTTA